MLTYFFSFHLWLTSFSTQNGMTHQGKIWSPEITPCLSGMDSVISSWQIFTILRNTPGRCFETKWFVPIHLAQEGQDIKFRTSDLPHQPICPSVFHSGRQRSISYWDWSFTWLPWGPPAGLPWPSPKGLSLPSCLALERWQLGESFPDLCLSSISCLVLTLPCNSSPGSSFNVALLWPLPLLSFPP